MAMTGLMLALTLLSQAAPQSQERVPAQPAVAEDREPDVLEEITVTAASQEAVQTYVRRMTAPDKRGPNQGQIARWASPVCLSVIGGTHQDNDRLQEAVIAVLTSLNVQVGRPACRPNAMVVVADDADGFAKAFTERYRNRFFEFSIARRAAFIDPPRPVRWEHRTSTGGAGRSSRVHDAAASDSSEVSEAIEAPDSRIKLSSAQRIDRSVVVLDGRRIDTVRLESLAAYVAFVTLADLPSDAAPTGPPTVLGLFSGGGAQVQGGLTRWDRAFIDSLYSIRNDQRFSMQQTEMELRMRRALETPEP